MGKQDKHCTDFSRHSSLEYSLNLSDLRLSVPSLSSPDSSNSREHLFHNNNKTTTTLTTHSSLTWMVNMDPTPSTTRRSKVSPPHLSPILLYHLTCHQNHTSCFFLNLNPPYLTFYGPKLIG